MTEIKDLAERLTDEILKSMAKISDQNGWSTQGAVPLDQAIGIVRDVRPQILEAYELGIIDAMPRQLVQQLRDRLSNLLSYAQNTVNGSPQVSEFVSQAEALNQDLWTWGLRYRGKKLLGFDAKIADLKRLIAQADALLKVSQEAASQRDEVTTIRANAQNLLGEIEAMKAEATVQASEIAIKAGEAETKQTELETHVEAIALKQTEAESSAASAKAQLQSAQTSQQALEAYYKKVDDYEKKLNKAVVDASSTVKKNDEDTKALVERLEVIEKDIRQKLEKATGVTLFEAFGKRQDAINKGLPTWLYASAGVLLLSAAYSVWLLVTADKIDVAFYVKLGFSLTFFAAVVFTVRQYGKERRLEEEYAFKAAISVSLAAYRGLVEQALEKLTPEERTEYATFLTKAVGTIFDPPTERVFGDRRSPGPTDTKVIASVAETIKPITDLIRPEK